MERCRPAVHSEVARGLEDKKKQNIENGCRPSPGWPKGVGRRAKDKLKYSFPVHGFPVRVLLKSFTSIYRHPHVIPLILPQVPSSIGDDPLIIGAGIDPNKVQQPDITYEKYYQMLNDLVKVYGDKAFNFKKSGSNGEWFSFCGGACSVLTSCTVSTESRLILFRCQRAEVRLVSRHRCDKKRCACSDIVLSPPPSLCLSSHVIHRLSRGPHLTRVNSPPPRVLVLLSGLKR